MTTELANAIEEVKRSRQALREAERQRYFARQAVIAAEQREQDLRDWPERKSGDNK